jgi:hypothetical protein
MNECKDCGTKLVKVGEEKHYVGVSKITKTSATIVVSSQTLTADLNIGEESKFDVTSDGFYDIYIKIRFFVIIFSFGIRQVHFFAGSWFIRLIVFN